MTEKQAKTHVKIQCQQIMPMKYRSYMQWNRYLRHHIDRTTKKFTKAIRVDVNSIEDRECLSKVIKENFGYGTFNVMFWSRYVKNKKFKYNFKCKGNLCPYLKNCRIKNKKKDGINCKTNSRFIPNWSPRATIIIKKSNNKKGYTYDYTMNKMYYFWFWADIE